MRISEMKVLIFYVVIFILSPKVCLGESTERKTVVDFFCVDAVDSLTVYAGGGDGVIMKTSDGEQWYQLQTGVSTEFQTICFLNPDTGWAGGELGALIKTTDGGQNWQTLLSTTSNLILSVYFSDPNTGWFCTNHGNIFKSTNGGMNWQLKNSGTSDPLSKIYFCDADTGWVCGNYETVLKTTNGGDNWVYTNYQQYSISLYYFPGNITVPSLPPESIKAFIWPVSGFSVLFRSHEIVIK